MTAQSSAWHIRVPGIVLLLAAGVFLGLDGGGLILVRLLGSRGPIPEFQSFIPVNGV
ncbi:MAG: hypothetical protein GXP53_06255 [Deltaproteobacteria bacterium]|nr:hypothetical protein [Deltaproteobacteria bacterium]